MTVSKDSQYAITIEEINCSGDVKKKIPKGSILKIQTLDDYGTFTFSDESDYESSSNRPRTYTSTSVGSTLFFPTNIFKFVIAISHPKERCKFVGSLEKQEFILSLNLNDPVKIPQAAFSSSCPGKLRRALVKYIGVVDDIAPGFYFIVSILVIFSI